MINPSRKSWRQQILTRSVTASPRCAPCVLKYLHKHATYASVRKRTSVLACMSASYILWRNTVTLPRSLMETHTKFHGHHVTVVIFPSVSSTCDALLVFSTYLTHPCGHLTCDKRRWSHSRTFSTDTVCGVCSWPWHWFALMQADRSLVCDQ
jgi:hypothetical protein